MTDTPPPPASSSLRVELKEMWSVLVLIMLCCLIESLLSFGDAGLIDIPRLRSTAYEYAGFWPGLLRAWTPNYALQPYTMFVTHAFLHSGPVHLLVNMATLYSLGRITVERVGTRGFVLLYAVSVLGGGLGFGWLAATTQPMVGASGGLFGLVGGVLAWNYVDRFSTAQRLWPVARAAALLIAINLAMWWGMDGLLAWQTHLGGFVTGWIGALMIDPRARRPTVED